MQGEFIDYVFSDASGGAKMVLADGFGLDAFLGFAGQEEESHYKPDEADEDDMGKMKGPPPRDRPIFCLLICFLRDGHPLVIEEFAIENGNRNSEFTHHKVVISPSYVSHYQRVSIP